jgi:hypothetical protein
MTEVVVTTDNLTVFGPPSIIDLQVDIGPKGKRGSQVFVGTGNPNSVVIGQDSELNDLYINNAPGAEFSYLYQYVASLGSNTWIPILKINPTIYSDYHTATYDNGIGTIRIPLINILDSTNTSLSASNFAVQITTKHPTNPTAVSITNITLTSGVSAELVIELSGVEYDGEWSALDGSISTYVFVSIVI